MLAQFFRCWATMFSSGIPVDACLRSLAAQAPPEFARTLLQIEGQLRGGQALSSSLEAHPTHFQAMHCQLVRVGESCGALELVFSRLASWEEGRLRLVHKVRAALVTPCWVAALCLLLAASLPPLLLQGLLPVFDGLELPWYSRCLIAFSAAVRHPLSWLLLLLALLGLRLVWTGTARRRAGPGWQRFWLSLPVLGPALELSAQVRFLQALETLLGCNTPLLVGLEQAGAASGNGVLQLRILEAVVQVRQGYDLGRALRAGGFPASMVVALESGLESGRMPAMVACVCRIYEIELDHALEVLARAWEPMFLVMMGSVVGFTVISLMVPLIKVVEVL